MTDLPDDTLVYDAIELLTAFEAYFETLRDQVDLTQLELTQATNYLIDHSDKHQSEIRREFEPVYKQLSTMRLNVSQVLNETTKRLARAEYGDPFDTTPGCDSPRENAPRSEPGE